MVDVGDEMEGCHERLKKDEEKEEIRRVKGERVCEMEKFVQLRENIYCNAVCKSRCYINQKDDSQTPTFKWKTHYSKE